MPSVQITDVPEQTHAVLRQRAAPHVPLLARCWELRATVTVCDACYVALAEALGATLLTADRRLAAATGPTCPVDVISAAR